MIKSQMFIAAALFAGVAIGYFVRPEQEAPAADAVSGRAAAVKVADKGESASIAALRARVAQLEKALAERADEAEAKVSSVERTEAAPQRRERRGPPNFAQMRERFERMEKEEPERFAQMTNRFAQMREHRRASAQRRIDFLASVDTSRMSETARKTHEELQNAIARRDELEERMHRRDLSDEERAELFGEMRETEREMGRLNNVERGNLISQTAEALGFTGDDATELTMTISEIIDATEGGWRGGWRGGPPPGPPN